jgi:hypothetical protein
MELSDLWICEQLITDQIYTYVFACMPERTYTYAGINRF